MSTASGPAMPRPAYTKPWLSCVDQVALLESRGILVGDKPAAQAFLLHVNYYRFSGYFLAFETVRHTYRAGIRFEQVRAAYDFDRVLRDLVTEALEVTEVDLRAAMAYHFGNRYGAFGHTTPGNFFHRFNHADWLSKLHVEAQRSSELFVTHFRAKYSQFPDLPIWIATEIMSFGALSIMFKGMQRSDQRVVAARYHVQAHNMGTWLHHLVYLRNLCAHHARLWDRVWAIKPTLPHGSAWQRPGLPSNDRLFVALLILHYLMQRCPAIGTFSQDWRDRVNALIDAPPAVADPLGMMGLALNWKMHPLWI